MSTRAAHALDSLHSFHSLNPQDETPTVLLHFPSPVPTSQPASATSPQTSPPKPRLASSHPDASLPDGLSLDDLGPFSLLDDIRTAQQQHSSTKERIALHQFPSYVTTNIRRVLARGNHNRADWSLALSCLLWRGLLRYAALPAAKALGDALLALDVDDNLGTVAAEQIEMWRRGCRFASQDPTHSMGFERVRGWKAPEHVHVELYERAGRLGLSGSSLGVVAVMAALEGQEGVLPDHGRYMREAVEQLDQLIEERERRLRGIMSAISSGVWR